MRHKYGAFVTHKYLFTSYRDDGSHRTYETRCVVSEALDHFQADCHDSSSVLSNGIKIRQPEKDYWKGLYKSNPEEFSDTWDLWGIREKMKDAQKEYQQKQRKQRRISYAARYKLFERCGARCQICGAAARDGATLEIDHIVPVSKGGGSELDNLQVLCLACNRGKSDRPMFEIGKAVPA